LVWLVLARSGSRSAAVCRVLLFLHAACRPLPGRAADFGLDMSGFVWSCLDVWISDCLDVWISMWTCLDLSGFVWICVCEHLSHVCQHLPLARDFCVNVNARGFVWSCLDVWISDCLDVWISMWTCLDLSGFVWICLDMCV
jgi:hypothetical protein